MISNDWKKTTLGEVCEKPQYGYTASTQRSPVGPRFLRITDLRDNSLDWNEVPFCQCDKNDLERYRLKSHDLVVARIGATTGRTSIVVNPPEAVFASYLIRLRPRAGVNPYFLYFFTQSDSYWTWIDGNKDNNLKGGVNTNILTQIEIVLPSKPEQEKIAAVLRKVQRAIETEEKLIATVREFKISTMRQMFTRGLRREQQKETEIGFVPESWAVVPLSKHLSLAQYGLSVRGQQAGKYPILRMNCQLDGQTVFRDLQFVDLDEKLFQAFRIQDGDLLFNRTNSFELVGRTAIFRSERDAVFASYLIRLSLDQREWHPEFVNYYFNQPCVQADLKRLASRGVSQSNISASKLKEYPVPKTNLDEQKEIAAIIQTIDRKISVHERKRTTLQELFKTLLHQLMTGQIRVQNLDIDLSEIQ